MNESGDLLYEGTQCMVAGDQVGALRYFLAAAQAQDVDGQLNAGFCYESGIGTRRSKNEALYWYRRAVRQSSAAAAFNYATLLRDRGNTRGTIYWLRRAAALGDDTAALELARLYLAQQRRSDAHRELVAARRGDLLAADSRAEVRSLLRRIRRYHSAGLRR